MPVIHLVRHGQASFGAQDYDALSDTGRVQAAVVGRELARRAPRDPLLVCGTLRRQRETAELLARAGNFGSALRTDARWNEYDHLRLLDRHGSAAVESPGSSATTGGAARERAHSAAPSSSREVQQLLDAALLRWIEADAPAADEDGWQRFSQGAGEALADLTAALVTAPADAVADPDAHRAPAARDAIVVTSGGVLAALCGRLLSLPAPAVVAVNRVMLNAAVTTVLIGRSGATLLALNDHAHLSGEQQALRTYR
ncbi:histidine phosphatase family protein [Streptomyces sp. XM4193]|uniref:histidine phosphatase family protein n=1 Tax=Streptomyces sp. XM4193 TaxID=2929782 RepID=UPI001FF753A7|nr:histidine phosphatase family protein [Streptomyces sp. XM4193]MCK1798938.1 histidine phosphatase family protein [Streptomyces sp. XM4193]